MSISVVPALKSELLASTALTPTQHKGGLSMVIGIVAAVAIPIAAPAIATAIGVSGTIGTALVGAGLGAATAAITGGDPLMGALAGGISGGIAGYNAPAPGLNGGTAAAAGGAPGQLTAPGIAGVAPVTTVPLAPAGMDPFAAANFATESAALGLAPSGAFQTATAGSSFIPGAANAANAPAGVRLSGNAVGPGGTSLGSASGTYAGQPGVAPAAPGPAKAPGFFDDPLGTIFSSDAAKQAGGRALTAALSNTMAGDTPNMTAEEEARMAQLAEARRLQKELLDKKQGVSDAYVQQAANINPEYYGQQQLTQEQNRLLRGQQAGLRQINPSDTGLHSATVRRNALDKARLGAFDRGRQEAEAKRLQYMQAAQGSAPTGAGYASGIASDLAAADRRYARLEDETKGYAEILEPALVDIFGMKKKKPLQEEAR